MQKTTKMIKSGLVALLLSATASVFGQAQVPPGPISPLGPQGATLVGSTARGELFAPAVTDFSEELASSILFFNPSTANALTLRASAIEDHEEDRGLSFTHYTWSHSTDGSTYDQVGTNSATLTHSGLLPGYHYFRVEARIVPTGTDLDLSCGADNTETFVVFVLPPLVVTPTNTAASPQTQYCETDAVEQENITLSAGVTYDPIYYAGDPAVNQFDFNYRWYFVKSTDTEDVFSRDNADFPTVDPSKADISQATLISGADEASYTPSISEIGTYKFFVEVEYQIRSRNYDESEVDEVTNRARPYVIYRGWYGGEDQATAAIVTVTPAPGKPHITIEEVID